MDPANAALDKLGFVFNFHEYLTSTMPGGKRGVQLSDRVFSEIFDRIECHDLVTVILEVDRLLARVRMDLAEPLNCAR
jgi:hypothetical protein